MQKLVTIFIEKLYEAAEIEYEVTVIICQIDAMRLCLQQTDNFLSKESISSFL